MDVDDNVVNNPTLAESLPNIPGGRYGLFMTFSNLKELVKPVKPVDGRSLMFLFCNDVNDKSKLDLSPIDWAFLLTDGQARAIKIEVKGAENTRDITYIPLSDSNDCIGCLEMYGVMRKNEWKAPQEVCKQAIMQLIRNALTLHNLPEFNDVAPATWIEINAKIKEKSRKDIFQAKVYNYMLTVIYSVCRIGSPSTATINKLKEEFKAIKSVDVEISSDVVKEYWNIMGRLLNSKDITSIFAKMRDVFINKSMRLQNLIRLAEHRNLTQYYCVKTAVNKCPNFPWEVAAVEIKEEFENYEKARVLVNDEPYFGYNPDIGVAAASYYPNLAYLCVQLCQRKLGQQTLIYYYSSHRDRINTRQWDKRVDKYISESEQMPCVRADAK